MRVKIEGTIVPDDYQELYDYWKVTATSPKKIESQIINLEEDEEAVFEINSGGGEIFAGSQIYTMIRALKNKSIEITGLAGSAASVIAMAGMCKISPTAMIMIHNVSTCASGDSQAFYHQAGVLEECNRAIAAAYVDKTGMAEAELLELMNRETWMSSTMALDLGFVDGILEPSGIYNATCKILTPDELREAQEGIKLKNKLEQERINLLKLGGNK